MLSGIERWSPEPEKGEFKRIHKYLILLVNPFFFVVFYEDQNAPENPYKSEGSLQTPVNFPTFFGEKISTFY